MKESFLRGGRRYADLYGGARRPRLGVGLADSVDRPLVALDDADADADEGGDAQADGDDGIGLDQILGLLPDGRNGLHLVIVSFLFCLFE